MHARLITENLTKLEAGLKSVKVVYSDLDNTLLGPNSSIFLTSNHEFSLDPAKALVALLQAGIDVVLVSGRNHNQLREVSRILNLENYIAELGCQISYHQGRELITNYDYQVPENKTLFEAISESGAPDFLLERFKGRLEYHSPWAANQSCTHLFRGLIETELANDALESEGFAGLRIVDNGGARGSASLAALPAIRAYHLLPKGTNKASAILRDRERRGFSVDETIALGDSLADLEMATAVGSFFLVADGISDDFELENELMSHENTYLTTKFMGLGWSEVANLVVAD